MLRHRPSAEDEVLAEAVRLYHEERDTAETARAQTEALRELEIPEEYLRRAEAAVREREAERAAKRRQRFMGLAAVVGIGLIIAVWQSTRPGPVAPFSVPPTAQAWRMDANPGTQATLRSDQGATTISVARFVPTEGTYWATARSTTGPLDVRGLTTVSVQARGELAFRVRFVRGDRSYLSPVLRPGAEWQTFRVPLANLTETQRDGNRWVTRQENGARLPDQVAEVQLQTGRFVNPPDATGTLQVRDVRFER